MTLNKADVKFVKDLLGKKCGFAMGARPVGAVDEKQMVIHDVAVCIQGEALGHGVWLDEAFIRGVIEQGNASEMLCHFGHEDSDAGRIKNYMGVFNNWVEKAAVGHDGAEGIGAYADIKFSKVAKAQGDNVDWVMGLARERPDALGLSIVFSIADYKIKTADGEILWSEYIEQHDVTTWDEYCDVVEAYFVQSVDGKLYVVLGKLYGADFVAEGAATDGLFARGDADADDPAAALREKFAKFAALSDAGEGSGQAETAADADAGSSPTEPAQESGTSESGAQAAEGTGESAQSGTQAESTQAESAEAQPKDGEEVSSAANDTKSEQESEAVAQMKAECEKRISGFQSMHDRKMQELNGQIDALRSELDTAKAAASALQAKFDEVAEELKKVGAERDEILERLNASETARRKLTGGALTIGDGGTQVPTMAEFVKDHGGSLSLAVKQDPETYKRICAANGWRPAALDNH